MKLAVFEITDKARERADRAPVSSSSCLSRNFTAGIYICIYRFRARTLFVLQKKSSCRKKIIPRPRRACELTFRSLLEFLWQNRVLHDWRSRIIDVDENNRLFQKNHITYCKSIHKEKCKTRHISGVRYTKFHGVVIRTRREYQRFKMVYDVCIFRGEVHSATLEFTAEFASSSYLHVRRIRSGVWTKLVETGIVWTRSDFLRENNFYVCSRSFAFDTIYLAFAYFLYFSRLFYLILYFVSFPFENERIASTPFWMRKV